MEIPCQISNEEGVLRNKQMNQAQGIRRERDFETTQSKPECLTITKIKNTRLKYS